HAHIRRQVFESYEAQARFHLVLSVHTHYFLADLRASLQKAWTLLEPGGELILFSALDVFLSGFFKVTFQTQLGHPPWLSHQVEADLHELGIPFRKQTLHAELDVSACFGADERRADDLLGFIVHADVTDVP